MLIATGMPRKLANSSLRMSLDESNTLEDLDYAVDVLKDIVIKLREMAPQCDDDDEWDCNC